MFNRREINFLIALSGVYFTLTVDFMILMPLGPQLMRLLNIGAKEFSQLVSVYTLSAGLAGLAASVFLDRLDRKKALLLFLAGFAAGNVFCLTVTEFETLLFARAWTGLFTGFSGAAIFAILSDAFAVEKRATAFGVVLSSFALASLVGIPVALVLAKNFSWQTPFLFVFVCTVTVWAFSLARLPSMTSHFGEAARTWASSFANLKLLVTGSDRVLTLSFMFFLVLGHFSLVPFLFPSIVANGGISEASLPAVYIAGGLASIVSSILFGRLADRYGKRKIFTYCLLASLPVILAVSTLGPSSAAWITFMVASFFVVMGGRMAPAMTLVTTGVSPETRGSFLSLMSSLQHLTTAVAAFVTGFIVIKTDDGKLLNFQYVGLLAVTCSLIALALAYRFTNKEI